MRRATDADRLNEEIGEALVSIVQFVVWLLTALVLNAIVVTGAALAAVSWLRWGLWAGIAAGVGATVVLITWWRLAPWSFGRAVTFPTVGTVWGGWVRLRWSHVASRHGLVSCRDSGTGRQNEVARLGRVIARPGLLRLRVHLPAGLTPDDVAAAADGLAHALRVREARVAVDRPGSVWLELHRRDLLAALATPYESRVDVDLAAVPIGQGEDGSPWVIGVRGTHLLLAGATGAGKSSVLWSLMLGLAARVRAGSVQVWAVDPKGGMELGRGRALFARYEDRDPEAMCDLVEDLVRVKDERARELARCGQRVHEPSASSPHLILVVDELATLTAFADRKTTSRVDTALGLLLTQGRACGITVVSAVQDPTKAVVGWRDLFPTRVALRLDNPIQVDMVLGDGARDCGARADQISELTPGVAFVRVAGTRELRRVRSSYLDDVTVDAMVREFGAGVRPVGEPAAVVEEVA